VNIVLAIVYDYLRFIGWEKAVVGDRREEVADFVDAVLEELESDERFCCDSD